MDNLKFVMVVNKEEGRYWAWFPELPGCFTDGDTLEELRANARDVIHGVLSLRHDEGREIPEGVADGTPEVIGIKNDPDTWKKSVRVPKPVEAR